MTTESKEKDAYEAYMKKINEERQKNVVVQVTRTSTNRIRVIGRKKPPNAK